MNQKVVCPWCGSVMEYVSLGEYEDTNEMIPPYYECFECGCAIDASDDRRNDEDCITNSTANVDSTCSYSDSV